MREGCQRRASRNCWPPTAKDDDTAGTAQIAVLKETRIMLRREGAAIEAPGRWWPWVAQQLRAPGCAAF
jgi:hypothetical protein